MFLFTLTRNDKSENGIFGALMAEIPEFKCVTLEHPYLVGEQYLPKLAVGTYLCQRGMHRLEGMDHDFEAFEILDVPAFEGLAVTKILFHIGNYIKDSHGCVLLGDIRQPEMITHSADAFNRFMAALEHVDQFQLVVRDL